MMPVSPPGFAAISLFLMSPDFDSRIMIQRPFSSSFQPCLDFLRFLSPRLFRQLFAFTERFLLDCGHCRYWLRYAVSMAAEDAASQGTIFAAGFAAL